VFFRVVSLDSNTSTTGTLLVMCSLFPDLRAFA
jgi:hypothetical protein